MSAPWICPSCQLAQHSNYCPACGERALTPDDLSLRGLAGQFGRAVTSIDGRLLRSVRCLLTEPGVLTLAYLAGHRRPYLGPLQLFLLANLMFFALQSLTHTDVFSTPLASHIEQQDWQVLARTMVANRVAAMDTTLSAYAAHFDRAVLLNAKSLIILMALAFATALAPLFRGSGRPPVTHIVFALHLYAFLLLVFCVSVALATMDRLLGGGGLTTHRIDMLLSTLNLLLCAVYLFRAIHVTYGATGLPRVLKVAFLTLLVAAIVPGYRFTLFVLTLYTTV